MNDRYDFVRLENQVAPGVDGVPLVADVYLPVSAGSKDSGRWPALLERTPYGRRLPRIVEMAQEAARRGYVCVIQDVRGRGDSGGTFKFMMNDPEEGLDGEFTVRWLSAQPWYNGRLATMGGSFSSANSAALAIRHPEGLEAQVQRDSGINYYRWMFRNHGMAAVGIMLPWIVANAVNGEEARSDPRVREELTRMRAELGQWATRLPLRRGESPLALAPSYEETYFSIIEKADDEEFWQAPMMRLDDHWDEYPANVAVLLISGWFAHHAAANFVKFDELGKRTTRAVDLIVGPWVHSPYMGQLTVAGDVDFGAEAGRFGPVNDLWLGWLDQHFGQGTAADAQARVRYFVMGSGDGHRTGDGKLYHGGQWRESDTWPLPSTSFRPFYLHEHGALAESRPETPDAAITYSFDPKDPCPAIGSTNLQATEDTDFVLAGPQDQRDRPDFAPSRGRFGPLNARADVVSFVSDELVDGVEVTGPVTAKLWFATSAPDTDIVVKLIDVYPPSPDYPEGYAMLVTEGLQRLRYRGNRGTAELAEPDRVYEIDIQLTPTSNYFKPGHQIRADITSAHFPAHDVNPNTGEALGLNTSWQVANQTICTSNARCSHVLLPLQPDLPGAAT